MIQNNKIYYLGSNAKYLSLNQDKKKMGIFGVCIKKALKN